MKTIVVKNSDKLTSLVHSRKIIDEYLVYLYDGETIVSGEVVYGDAELKKLVKQLRDNNTVKKVVKYNFTEYINQFKDEE
jgi:hypothetical protein